MHLTLLCALVLCQLGSVVGVRGLSGSGSATSTTTGTTDNTITASTTTTAPSTTTSGTTTTSTTPGATTTVTTTTRTTTTATFPVTTPTAATTTTGGNASKVSRTRTPPLPIGVITQNTYGLDNVRLQRGLVYPPASIRLSIVNDLFVLSDECKSDITITGPGLDDVGLISSVETVVAASVASSSTSSGSVTGASGSFTFPDDVPGGTRDSASPGSASSAGETASSIRIVFVGSDQFSPSLTSIYNISIPSTCMVSGSPPNNAWAVFFKVYDIRSTITLAQSITFCGYLAAVLAFVAAFMGSITPLLLLHVFAVSVMTTCAPTAIMDEFKGLRYILMPVDVAISDLSYNARYVVWTVIVAAGFAAVEGFRQILIYFGVTFRFSFRDTELDDLEAGRGRHRKNARRPAGGHAETLVVPERERDSEPTDAEGGDAALQQSQAKEDAEREAAFEHHADSSTLMIQPPYLLICFIISAFSGLIANATATLLSGVEIPQAVTALGAVCLLVGGLGVPLAAYGFGRRNRFHYCTYTGVLGNLPFWMQPTGVWGPNSLRLRCGVLIDDTTEGKRFFVTVMLLFVVITSVAIGSSPTRDLTCRATLAVCVAATVVLGLLLTFLSPLRSHVSNYGAILCTTLLLCFQVSQLVFITTDASYCSDSWSRSGEFDEGSSCNGESVVTAQYAFGALTCLACGALAVAHITIIVFEVKDRGAYLHVRAFKKNQLSALTTDSKEEEARLNKRIEELCEVIDKHRAQIGDDDGKEVMSSTGITAASLNSKAQQARRQRDLEEMKAIKEEAEKRTRSRGIRAAYEQVRPPATLIPGDAAHPSLADFLVQDYALVPEDTKREYRTVAQMRRDRDLQFSTDGRRKRGESSGSLRGGGFGLL